MMVPLVKSSSDHDEQPSQASSARLPDVSMSGSPDPLGSMRGQTHPCRGYGRDEGVCLVRIPDGRVLCHYCLRTATLDGILINELGLPNGLQCPLCPGDINASSHFQTLGHILAVRREQGL